MMTEVLITIMIMIVKLIIIIIRIKISMIAVCNNTDNVTHTVNRLQFQMTSSEVCKLKPLKSFKKITQFGYHCLSSSLPQINRSSSQSSWGRWPWPRTTRSSWSARSTRPKLPSSGSPARRSSSPTQGKVLEPLGVAVTCPPNTHAPVDQTLL